MDGNFSFFALPAAADNAAAKLQLDAAGNPLRKRQPHHKSRRGCATCKRRKVKCDETSPACLNCTKRNLKCSFKPSSESSAVTSRKLIQAMPVYGPPQNSPHDSLVSLDRQDREPSFSCIFPLQTIGFGVQVKDIYPNSIFRELNAEQSQSSLVGCLEKLEKHSEDHRPGVACPTCYSRSGVAIEDVDQTEELIPSCNFIELAPRLSHTERELFLHFEKSTSQHLAFSTTLWQTAVLRNALQCDFVKSVVLLVAAAHKNRNLPLHPHDRRTDLQHLSNALSGLRCALNSSMTLENCESIINCGMLLVHYAWAHMEHDLNGDLDIAVCFRQTSDHFHGLKDCIVISHQIFSRTKWAKVLLYSPRVNLERYLMESKLTSDKLENIFLHCLNCGLHTKNPSNTSDHNISAIKRLMVVLNVICISSPDIESTGLLPDIYRYLFTWPSSGRMNTKGFILQIGEGNPVSLTILLYYYAAILRVYTEKIWFMRDGATLMFNTLRTKLGGHCSQCTDIPLSLLAPHEQQVTAA